MKETSPKTHRAASLVTLAALLLLLIAPIPVTADQYGDFTYSTDGTNATITGYTGSGGAVVIPDTIDFLPVTGIGGFAFWKCTSLTNIVIPNSVSSIGYGAFGGCQGLTSAEIDGGVIGDSMFFGCTNLTNATIGNSINSIEHSAFNECTRLTSIVIPNNVTNIGQDAFADCNSLANVTMSSNLTSIGESAFGSCGSLTGMTIPESVVNIGNEAFSGCTNLTNIILPNSAKSIGDEAFYECTDLTGITIPSNVTNIGIGPFAGCTSLTTIMVNAENPYYSSVDGVLFDKSQRTIVEYPGGIVGGYSIPDSVTNIAAEAFEDCPHLTSVIIPGSIIGIGDWAFAGCTNLTTLTIPNNVICIGNFAFDYCYALKNVTIGSNVTSVGELAFEGCTNLTSVTIPSSVTNFGAFAFAGCIGLTNVYFLGNAPNIDYGRSVYVLAPRATVYYLPGTIGWVPQVDTSGAGFGVQSNQFGFTITGNSSLSIVVEACTNLAQPIWAPVATNIPAGSYFSDPLWTNYLRFHVLRYPARFYRLRASTFAGLPMVLWNPQAQTSDGSFGVGTNGFGFNIVGTTNIPIVLEASPNLTGAAWTVLQSCILTNGSVYFGDPAWTNYPSRFYRIRSP